MRSPAAALFESLLVELLFVTKIRMSCIIAGDTRLDLNLQGWIRASRGEIEPPKPRFDALESEFPTMGA